MKMQLDQKKLKWQIIIIQLTVVMAFIGLAIPYTIFPIIFVKNVNASHMLLYSFLLSSYPLGQFIGMPVIGHLSDLFGRKRILSCTLLGATVSFILSGICIYLRWYYLLIFVRFFSGIFEGNSAIALAMINDLKHLINSKLKWFGKINVALTMGYLIGPLLGSFFSNHQLCGWFNFSTPFFVAAAIYFLTFIVVRLFFIETKSTDNIKIEKFNLMNIWKIPLINSYHYLMKSKLSGILLVSLFITSSADILYQFIPVYLAVHWAATANTLALGVFLLSIGKIFGGGYLVNTLFDMLKSEVRCIFLGLAFFVILILLLIKTKYLLFYMLLLLGIGVCISILITNSMTLISNTSEDHEQGSILGVAQSQRALWSIVVCNIASILCIFSFYIPFLMSVGFCLLSFIFLWHMAFKKTCPVMELV